MKAYRIHELGGPEGLKVDDLPNPKPAHGQVVVRVRATSLNYRDTMVLKGGYGRNPPLPLIPLSDGAGEIAEVGPGVTRWKTGDRVMGGFMPGWVDGPPTDAGTKTAMGGAVDGMLAEHVVLPESGIVRTPDHLTDEEAATLPCAAVTAWVALFDRCQIKAGETVLIQGTGGVSMFALQFARIAGARVIATSSRADKIARVLALGASDAINYKTTVDWDVAVRDLTGGNGVDHVVEVGGAGTLPRSIRAVRMGGNIALIGVLTGGEIDPRPILMKNIHLQGIFVGSIAMFEGMTRVVSLHKLKPIVDQVFPFDQAPAAYRHLQSGEHFGKVVIQV